MINMLHLQYQFHYCCPYYCDVRVIVWYQSSYGFAIRDSEDDDPVDALLNPHGRD